MKLNLDCPNCNEYAEKRAPFVFVTWFRDTGKRADIPRFMAGVHSRHESGLPILADR